MKKIISLFQKNHATDHLARNDVTPGAEWVVAGEGKATRKLDGTCCMVRGGRLFKRREVHCGPPRDLDANGNTVFDYNFPPGFELESTDDVTHKAFGWVPVTTAKEDRWCNEAFGGDLLPDGTYELCGPKINGNPEASPKHELFLHGAIELPECPRDFDGIRKYLSGLDIEGVVWHNHDGRMVKVKCRDFGIKRIKISNVT